MRTALSPPTALSGQGRALSTNATTSQKHTTTTAKGRGEKRHHQLVLDENSFINHSSSIVLYNTIPRPTVNRLLEMRPSPGNYFARQPALQQISGPGDVAIRCNAKSNKYCTDTYYVLVWVLQLVFRTEYTRMGPCVFHVSPNFSQQLPEILKFSPSPPPPPPSRPRVHLLYPLRLIF